MLALFQNPDDRNAFIGEINPLSLQLMQQNREIFEFVFRRHLVHDVPPALFEIFSQVLPTRLQELSIALMHQADLMERELQFAVDVDVDSHLSSRAGSGSISRPTNDTRTNGFHDILPIESDASSSLVVQQRIRPGNHQPLLRMDGNAQEGDVPPLQRNFGHQDFGLLDEDNDNDNDNQNQNHNANDLANPQAQL